MSNTNKKNINSPIDERRERLNRNLRAPRMPVFPRQTFPGQAKRRSYMTVRGPLRDMKDVYGNDA